METILEEPETELEEPVAEIIQPEDVSAEDYEWAQENLSRE